MRDQAEPSWQRVAPSRATQMNAVEFADGALFFFEGCGFRCRNFDHHSEVDPPESFRPLNSSSAEKQSRRAAVFSTRAC